MNAKRKITNHWRKFETVDTLLDALEQEIPNTHVSTQSGCPLPKGESCAEVAWCREWPQLAAVQCVKTMSLPNQALLKHFRNWLHLSGFSCVGRLVYGYAARLVFGLSRDTDWRHLPYDAIALAHAEIVKAELCKRLTGHLLDGLSRFETYLNIRRARSLLPQGKRMGLPWPLTDIAPDDFVACWGDEPAQDSSVSGCVPMKSGDGARRRFIKTSSLPRLVREAIKPSGLKLLSVRDWSQSNQAFYQQFRNWLHASGYGPSALFLYGVAMRLAFSLVSKDWRHWHVGDPHFGEGENDIQHVRDWINANYDSSGTRHTYLKGVDKLAQYLHRRQARPSHLQRVPPMPHLNRASVTATTRQRQGLPEAMLQSLEAYFAHCQRNWARDRLAETGRAWWANLTLPLRQMREMGLPIESASDITPARWYAYVDARLAAGISPVTLNGLLAALRGWLWFVEEAEPDAGACVDARMLSLRKLREPTRVPKDVPPDALLKLQRVIELAVLDANAHTRWRGMMDLAWFLLMLHSGLRTGEVRRLKSGDVDWSRRQIRIEGSKLLRSRVVPMSLQAAEALNNWITLRGTDPDLPETVFLDRHKPLSQTYCYSRLNTYAARCGIGNIHPHQLRHSCATLLLNAGMPLHQVQAVLGHANIETTRGYARSYDGTVAADYTRAMLSVEQDLGLVGDDESSPTPMSQAQIVALLDSLKTTGVLNPQQLDTLALARAGVVGLAKLS